MAKDSVIVLLKAIQYLNENGSYAIDIAKVDNMRAAKKKK
jgi:hypothetical protein